jgi:DNA-binding NtrC family response regulator
VIGSTTDIVELAAAGLTASCSFLSLAARSACDSLDRIVERDRVAAPPPRRAVLVLNDEPHALDAIVALLKPLDVPLILASNAAEARASLDRDRPCAIVADYYLGRGETCAEVLRDRRPRTRAVIVTGAVDTTRIASIARGVGADLREVPLTEEAQRELVALVASYLPPEAA